MDKALKIKELKSQIDSLKTEVDYYNALQMSRKDAINGSYGAFANPHFCFFNNELAATVTAIGRNLIQWMDFKNEAYWYEKWHLDTFLHEKLGVKDVKKLDPTFIDQYKNVYYPIDRTGTKYESKQSYEQLFFMSLDKLERWLMSEFDPKIKNIYQEVVDIKHNRITRLVPLSIYVDTDSVDKDTVINTNLGKMKISDLYNKCLINSKELFSEKGHLAVSCKDFQVLNWTEEKGLYYVNVKYVMKHKVSKQKWKLKTKSGKEIYVTNDHSLIVFRNGLKMEVKPSEILKTDKILTI